MAIPFVESHASVLHDEQAFPQSIPVSSLEPNMPCTSVKLRANIVYDHTSVRFERGQKRLRCDATR